MIIPCKSSVLLIGFLSRFPLTHFPYAWSPSLFRIPSLLFFHRFVPLTHSYGGSSLGNWDKVCRFSRRNEWVLITFFAKKEIFADDVFGLFKNKNWWRYSWSVSFFTAFSSVFRPLCLISLVLHSLLSSDLLLNRLREEKKRFGRRN